MNEGSVTLIITLPDSDKAPTSTGVPNYHVCLNRNLYKRCDRISTFLSKRRRIDILNIQQLILKKESILERKKLSKEIVMEEFKPT